MHAAFLTFLFAFAGWVV